MRWGKFILVFQAVLTLVIGLVFFSQVINIQNNYEHNIKQEVKRDFTGVGIESVIVYEKLEKYNEFKMRFFRSSYILIIISLMEILLIWRLFDIKKVASFDTEFDFRSDFGFSTANKS
jgi:hypothetical protein